MKRTLVAGLVMCLAVAATAQGGAVFPTDHLPPQGVYEDNSGQVVTYSDGFTAVMAWGFSHHTFSPQYAPPDPGPDVLTYNSTLEFTLDVGSLLPFADTSAQVGVTAWLSSDDGTTRVYDMEMNHLNGDDTGGFLDVLFRESPLYVSSGQTSITDLGDGNFHIDSFFDVWTELSLNNGASWLPADRAIRLELIPEPATMGLLALGGLAMLSRRK